jgi:hypothetical protein
METAILFELGDHWVRGTSKGGFEVMRNCGTHAERVAQIGYKGERGIARAIEECRKRESVRS